MKYKVLSNAFKYLEYGDIIESNDTEDGIHYFYKKEGVGRIKSKIVFSNPNLFAPLKDDKWSVTDTGYYVNKGSKYIRVKDTELPNAFDGLTKEHAEVIANALNEYEGNQ